MRLQHLFALGASFLFLSATCLSQLPPQDGTFVLICSMHGEANQGQSAWQKDDVCNLPKNFPLGKSYHQSAVNFTGGGATTNLTPADIPAGIHLNVTGNYFWSIVQPIKLVILDTDDLSTNLVRQFGVHTYCGPSGGNEGGCSVHVDVYARKKQ